MRVLRAIVMGVEEPAPSRRVVEQRVRNRIIEYLDLAASYEEQAEYKKKWHRRSSMCRTE